MLLRVCYAAATTVFSCFISLNPPNGLLSWALPSPPFSGWENEVKGSSESHDAEDEPGHAPGRSGSGVASATGRLLSPVDGDSKDLRRKGCPSPKARRSQSEKQQGYLEGSSAQAHEKRPNFSFLFASKQFSVPTILVHDD